MATSKEMHLSEHKDDVQLTEKEKFRLAIGLGAIACGITVAFGSAVYFFGAETTIDATIATLAFGAVVSFGAVLCFRAFGKGP